LNEASTRKATLQRTISLLTVFVRHYVKVTESGLHAIKGKFSGN